MQSCTNCENEYDAQKHIPRILISCGHTFCSVCISLVIQEEVEAWKVQQQQQQTQVSKPTRGGPGGAGSAASSRKATIANKKDHSISLTSGASTPQQLVFECFECGIPCQIDPKLGVNALPKNMVLIPAQQSTLNQQQTTGETHGTDMSTAVTGGGTRQTQLGQRPGSKQMAMGVNQDGEQSSSLLNIVDEEAEQNLLSRDEGDHDDHDGIIEHALCRIHPTKKIEAFCEKDFKLLCIDCILSERHKNHEIVSTAKAAEKHLSYLRQQQEQSINVAQKLISSKNEISRHMQLMKLQAEQNRRELSVLYNSIREMLMQREQALKTYISEVYQKEESQCEAKINQIETALSSIEEFDENLLLAFEESEIDLLRRFNERKLLVNTFNADTQIKDLQQLNVAQNGLSIAPVQTVSAKSKKAADLHPQQDDSPPFQSLQDIKKDLEQLQVSKMINPNFKGQISNCTGILPFTRSNDDKAGGAGSSAYQQHTAASQLKVNRRATMGVMASGTDKTPTGVNNNNTVDKASDEHVVPQASTRPFNQYRRTGTTAASNTQHQSNASPKPGDNKRRTAANHAYGASSGVGGPKGVQSGIGARGNHQLMQQRTHSYNLNNMALNNVNNSSNNNGDNSGKASGHAAQSKNEINLFNQLKSSGTGPKRNTLQQSQHQGVSSRLYPYKQQNTMLQQVTTQRVSLQDDTSLDLKHIVQTGSDKQLLKTSKQNSGGQNEQIANSSTIKPFSGTQSKRQQRVAQEKQINDDLLNVQKQVNQVMSNLETFESKKRQLSAKKDARAGGLGGGGKMFQRGSPSQQLLQERKDYSAVNKKKDARDTQQLNQRPLTNQMHKRNSSSVCNDSNSQLNNSDVALARRMTSPPGKQQLQASQQPRKPAADNVIGNISIDNKTQNNDQTEDDSNLVHIKQPSEGVDEDDMIAQRNTSKGVADGHDAEDEELPVVHIKLEEQQQTLALQKRSSYQLAERKLSNPNPQIKLQDGDKDDHSDFGAGDSAIAPYTGDSDHNQPPQKETSDQGPDSSSERVTRERKRMKSPIIRINLNSEEEKKAKAHDSQPQRRVVGDDETEENIANLPEMHNDSMVGDLNQLINDLNSGKSRKSGRPDRQQSADRKMEDVENEPSDSFDKQAKALYFDLGTSGDFKNDGQVQQSKTIDYIEGEYQASASRRPGVSGKSSHNSASAEKQDQSSKSQNRLTKQKYIEQSNKALQIQQNIQAVSQQNLTQSQQTLIQRQKSSTRVPESQRDTSQPRSNRARVPDLQLGKVGGDQQAQEQYQYDFLKSDRQSQEQTQPTVDASQKVASSLQGVHTHEGASPLLSSQVTSQTSADPQQASQLLQLANSQQNQVLSASSSAQSFNANSVSQASIDPFKALCQIRDEYIFVFSGFNERKLTHCEVFDAQRGLWKEIAQIQNPRTKFAAVPISKTRILIFGGKQADGQRTADIEEYNLKSNSFKTLPFKMPKARSGFAACIKKDESRIYFCGGNSGSGSNGSVLRKFDCLDLKKGKWTRLNDMLMKRDELSVAFGPDGNIYAIGGFGGGLSQPQQTEPGQEGGEGADQALTQESAQAQAQQSSSDQYCQCLKEAERFNFMTQQWEMLPPMKEARRALAAVVLPDGIYAIGGYDGRQYLATVEKFDLSRQEWVYVKSMNTARCTLSAVASSDCQYIYVLGGYNGKALNLVERYSVMSNSWELMPPMNVKRFMHQSVTLLRQEM